jgi:hypothetical protein
MVLKGSSAGPIIRLNARVTPIAAANSANDEIGGLIVGTSVHQGTAANSLVLSNITTDGDIQMLVSDDPGNSKEFLFADGSAANLVLGHGMATATVKTASGDLTLSPGGSLRVAVDTFTAASTGLVVGHTAKITAQTATALQVLGTSQTNSGAILGRFDNGGAGSPKLVFVKSRNGSIGSNTIVADNDTVMTIQAMPDDGVDFATVAAIFSSEVDDASPEAGGVGMAFVWSQMAGGGTSAARETMRLSAAGALSLSGESGSGLLNVGASGNDWDSTGITLIDDDRLKLGTGTDLEIWHDGSNSYIEEHGTGALFIQSANAIKIRNVNGEQGVTMTPDGAVELFHNGSERLATSAAGVSISGDIDLDDNALTNVGQIGFLASQDASSDANTLDDYEEGTWTPGIADDTGDTTGEGQAYSYQVGTYVKIGKTVFLKGSVSISDLGTMAAGNGVQLRGLPFTAATLTSERSSAFVGSAASLAITAGWTLSGVIYSGSSIMYINTWSLTSGTTSLRIDALSDGGSLFFTAIYDAA